MTKISSLELAIKNERAEIEFYENEAKISSKAATRALFEILANQEENHIIMLQEIAQHSIEKGTWPERIDTSSLSVNVAQVLDQLKSLGGTTLQDTDDIAALQQAVVFEKNAEAFYTKLADESTDKQVKVFFRTIAGFERDHLIWIETFLATLREDLDK